MRIILILTALAVVAGPALAANVASVPMNAQINLGYTYNTQSPLGDAIYPAFNTDTQTFEVTEGGFTRHHLVAGQGGGSYFYQYVDFNLAGITTPGAGLDLSGTGSTVTFDTRYFQDADSNSNPYGDAPVFLRLYTYAADGNTYLGYRDYSIVYATQAPWSNPPYPTWTTVTVDVNAAPNISEGGSFDVHNVSRLRWYGTDWSGSGSDFVDFRNLSIDAIPEPSSILVLLAGLGALAPLVRRRK